MLTENITAYICQGLPSAEFAVPGVAQRACSIHVTSPYEDAKGGSAPLSDLKALREMLVEGHTAAF